MQIIYFTIDITPIYTNLSVISIQVDSCGYFYADHIIFTRNINNRLSSVGGLGHRSVMNIVSLSKKAYVGRK